MSLFARPHYQSDVTQFIESIKAARPELDAQQREGRALLWEQQVDADWNADTFIPQVGKRGAAIIEARGLSSAASAANAAIDHIRDWVLGSNGKWVTMGVPSDGSYGIPEGVMYGVPVTTANGEYTRVEGLPVDEFSRAAMDSSGAWSLTKISRPVTSCAVALSSSSTP